MKTVVVNLYKDHHDVYVGRAGKGQDGYFGNPFNNADRNKSIKLFKKYFYEKIHSDPEFHRRVLALKGKVLGCFCKPKKCHADVITDYLNNLKPLNLGVVGSRTFNDYQFLCDMLKWHDIKKIISGGAKGADSLAERYAAEKKYPLKVIMPEWEEFGKSAGYRRNVQIVEQSDEIIAFWDGNSKGTAHTIKIAEDSGKSVYTYWPETPKDEIAELGW